MGEKLSFNKLLSEKNYIIEIPIIQRDYAQGRKNEQVDEIREKFLMNLKNSLDSDQPVELDFIYGSIIFNGGHDHFTPLDGQQRLTTLFLLHWYLAFQENRMQELRALLLSGEKARFTYETRASAREFCKGLVENDISVKDEKISERITDASWFFSSWKTDATIASMLVVLDNIEKIFGKTGVGFYDKLINKEHPLICFQFIELKDFGLTDSLYVKMNSRGKELTEFENFKARIEQHIKKIDAVNGTDIYSSFSRKIDAGWTDLFWHYRDRSTDLFDDQLMNFIREMVISYYASTQLDSKTDDKVIRLLTDEKVKVTFSFYEQNNCLGRDCIEEISGALDQFMNGVGGVRTYLDEGWLYSEIELFEGAIKNALSYTERVIFYGIYKYLIRNEVIRGELFNWIRVIQNLAINTIYNDATDFARSIRAVSQLLPYSRDILTHFATMGSAVQGFADIQIVEERIKALLIKKGENWKNAVYNLERHGYFRGQIDFLLSFAGIKDYYRANDNLSWGGDKNAEFLNKFLEYGEKAAIMFTQDGLNEFDDYLWQRALLTKGDYLLLTANRRNKCFLVNDDRDTSWKRLLRDDTSNRSTVKELLDAINIDTVKQDLSDLIQLDKTLSWCRYFIQRPRILDECGTKMLVRFYDESNILLLEKTQVNGWHKEYYSYALAIRLEDMGNDVKYSGSNSYEESNSIDKINDRDAYIVYEDGRYSFWIVAEQYEKFDTEDEIVDYLSENNYLV